MKHSRKPLLNSVRSFFADLHDSLQRAKFKFVKIFMLQKHFAEKGFCYTTKNDQKLKTAFGHLTLGIMPFISIIRNDYTSLPLKIILRTDKSSLFKSTILASLPISKLPTRSSILIACAGL